ncbi:hypothetical protein [Streptomyces virginiae]|uniref:hypothetical protein n=1 Tax=Streptomyces virginiae TaxID=1961 RepID=UPI00364C7597
MEHLLTVESWEADGASRPTWTPVEDQGVRYEDSGLMLGDAGGVYFFECRQLPGASGQGALRLLLSTRAPAVAGPESPSDPPASWSSTG